MKKLITILFLLHIYTICLGQEIEYKTYSYTELFQFIENEKDSVFELKDAFIKYNLETDSLFFNQQSYFTPEKLIRKETLIIDKKLLFDNVHFQNHIFRNQDKNAGYLINIHFKKEVRVLNGASFNALNCIFDETLTIRGSGEMCQRIIDIAVQENIKDYIHISQSVLKKGIQIFINCNFVDAKPQTNIGISYNEIFSNKDKNQPTNLDITTHRFGSAIIHHNIFKEKGVVIISNSLRGLNIFENDFKETTLAAGFEPEDNNGSVYFTDNKINTISFLSLPTINRSFEIDYEQFTNVVINQNSWYLNYSDYLMKINALNKGHFNQEHQNDSLQKAFVQNDRYKNLKIFNSELASKGAFYDYYKSKHNLDVANKIYVDIKDLETRRLEFLQKTNPSFENFFTWKINQFLKVFSAYGTKPAKAVIFSMYVILFFAFIYLLFPNSWDRHGKNRIKDRFLFFHKYLRHPKGIHDVYLEDQKETLENSLAFQKIMDDNKSEVPPFFYNAAKPLYKWSVAGTLIYAKLLSKVDFLKGSWKETDAKTRSLKTALTIVIFIIALVYDIFIKALNALMLSLNTFTTLGFGEIPIKGLPRYLAIIQGFIGWFMLTIFSVSLISQLLN